MGNTFLLTLWTSQTLEWGQSSSKHIMGSQISAKIYFILKAFKWENLCCLSVPVCASDKPTPRWNWRCKRLIGEKHLKLKGKRVEWRVFRPKYRSDILERREVRKNWIGKDLDYNVALRNSWPGWPIGNTRAWINH